MFDVEVFKANIAEAESMSVNDRNDYIWMNRIWRERIDIITKDDNAFASFMEYMKTDMTPLEYAYLSEVSDEIGDEKPSFAFLEAYEFLAQKYPEETKRYQIESFIASTEYFIERHLGERQK